MTRQDFYLLVDRYIGLLGPFIGFRTTRNETKACAVARSLQVLAFRLKRLLSTD